MSTTDLPSSSWHKNALWLSNKSRNNDSSGTSFDSVSKLMSVDIVRDNIMYWLLPIDVIDFVIGTGIFFSETDMAKYTNVFKYIIPDRRWLIKKTDEGHSFTIFGTDLNELKRLGKKQKSDSSNSRAHDTPQGTTQVNLVVRKGNRFVRCNSSFLPKSLFAASHCSDEANHIVDDNALFSEPKSRRIKVTRGCDKLYIWCPSTHISTNQILRIGFRWPWRWRRHCMRQFQVYETKAQEDCEMWYAHFERDRRTVLRRSVNIDIEDIQKKAEANDPVLEGGLFWIAISDDTISRDFRFQIDR